MNRYLLRSRGVNILQKRIRMRPTQPNAVRKVGLINMGDWGYARKGAPKGHSR